MSITLRDARPEDEAFLLEVYASTRANEMLLVPWTDEQKDAFVEMQFRAQHSDYHERFPDADYKLILQDDKAVGRIYVLREKEAIRVLDITVLPQYRNAGIGTLLIEELLSEAGHSGEAVRIYVETFNQSLGLFERLGFSRIAEEGINFLLEWRLAT
jgi:ribosomal protein S18 acetylase RimI-like enzyme